MDIRSFFPAQQQYADLPVRLRQEEYRTISLLHLDLIEKVLQSDEEPLLQRVLSVAEQGYFQRFKYMKRKKEWLGGRIAAKAALLAFTRADAAEQDLRRITVLPDTHGRPVIEAFSADLSAQGNRGKALSISLSHSDGFAVALASESGNCGIDLQEISAKLAGLTDHFATDAELRLLAEQTDYDDYDEDTCLTMLWTVKEALKKALLHDQSVIFSATELCEIFRLNDSVRCFTCTVQGRRQSVLVRSFPPYILSMTAADNINESNHA